MEYRNLIQSLCDSSGYKLTIGDDNSFRITTNQISGLILNISIDSNEKVEYHYLVRTYDVIYDGDRSDVHVIMSLMFNFFLRKFTSKVSCSLFDIAHPMVDDEIWGRYIIPEQISIESHKEGIKGQVVDAISKLVIWHNLFGQFVSCPCLECNNGKKLNSEIVIDAKVLNCSKEVYDHNLRVNLNARHAPLWQYKYDIENELTIIKSKQLASFLEHVLSLDSQKVKTVKGVNGDLIIEGDIENYISSEAKDEFAKISKYIFGKEDNLFQLVPCENMIIGFQESYIIALGRLSGFREFRSEREIVRKRHNFESDVLFPISEIIWNTDICPDQFELLIKALLERENTIVSVRRPAPINQGDKGRDLIIEKRYSDKSTISQDSPTTTIMIVGQCKVSKKSVGKSKVQDIRDTVDFHNARGYFLAVSSQLSLSLTEKLENLKGKGIFTDWWNREDIESRLVKHPDLIKRFDMIVDVKNHVKFYQKT